MKLSVLGSSSAGNCYLLEASDGVLVVECGVPFIEVKKALDFKIGRIFGAIVTHQHGDHAKFIAEYLKSAIRVYALQDVFDSAHIMFNHFCKSIEVLKQYRIGSFSVKAFSVVHDVPCVGYLIEHAEMGKMLFLTDTVASNVSSSNLNHILIEANYSDEILDYNIENGITPASMRARLLNSHMEIKTTESVLSKLNLAHVSNIVLIHLSGNNSDAQQFKHRIMQTTGKPTYIAQRGLTLDVSKY